VADAEPAPTPDASVARVPASALEVAVQVAPATPSVAQAEGFFTVTVTARNPASHPVVVVPAAGGSLARSFVLGVQADFGSFEREESAPDPSLALFAAGETKRQVYDFRVVPFGTPSGAALGARVLPPGAYTITARFDERSTGPRPLPLNP
jgi:hypothetical protein